MTTQTTTLSRAQVKRILLKARVSAQLARDLGVTHSSVSVVLSGRMKSKNIMNAAEAKAREILATAQQKAVA